MNFEEFHSVTKVKQNFSLLAIAGILSVLIIVRLILPEGSYSWINFVNYLGLVIAIISLFFSMCSEFQQSKRFYPIVGFFVVLFIVFIIIGILILTNILVPNAKVNDSIMLLTLLISYASLLFVKKMGQCLKK